jgi:hypothetical protein
MATMIMQMAQPLGSRQQPQQSGGNPSGGGNLTAGGRSGLPGGGGAPPSGEGGGPPGGGGGQSVGGALQQVAGVHQPGANGALKGMPPATFLGKRGTAEIFLQQFQIYRNANRCNEAMANPFEHTNLALTFMAGEAAK